MCRRSLFHVPSFVGYCRALLYILLEVGGIALASFFMSCSCCGFGAHTEVLWIFYIYIYIYIYKETKYNECVKKCAKKQRTLIFFLRRQTKKTRGWRKKYAWKRSAPPLGILSARPSRNQKTEDEHSDRICRQERGARADPCRPPLWRVRGVDKNQLAPPRQPAKSVKKESIDSKKWLCRRESTRTADVAFRSERA